MAITVDATYENGVLKPAQPLRLQEHAQVRVTIDAKRSWVEETAGILPWKGTPEELQRFAEDAELDYPPPPGEP
jgi:predicted DNA-binding antitoxin AbrB/MazE fold protein